MSLYKHDEYSPSFPNPFGPPEVRPKSVKEIDLADLRRASAYPAFRAFCSMLWWISLVLNGLLGLSGLTTLFDPDPYLLSRGPGLMAVILALIGVFFAKVAIEAALMLADIADCSIDSWRRNSNSELASARHDDESAQPSHPSPATTSDPSEHEEVSSSFGSSTH